MTFKEWLISERFYDALKQIDKDDAEYLNQFPPSYQAQALQYRYKLLPTRSHGEIRDVVLSKRGQTKIFPQINTKINTLAEKLEKQGINPDKATPPSMKVVYDLVANWRQMSNIRMKRRGLQSKDLFHLPGSDVPFTTSKGMVPDDYWDRSNLQWEQASEEILPVVKKLLNKSLERLSNPRAKMHLNYYYWNDRKKELIKGAINNIKNKYLDNLRELMDNPTVLKNILISYFNSKFQRGLVPRRMLDRSSIDIPDLLSKGISPYDIADIIKGKRLQQTA